MELTEDQQKGLGMMAKVLSKNYPYIIGVLPNVTDFEEYLTLLTVKLVISKSKLESHFRQKVATTWGNEGEFFRFSNILYPNPDPESAITEEIKRLGRMFYTSLGDEYQFENGLSVATDFRTVKINSFILDDKN
jgi:hypothetical protein